VNAKMNKKMKGNSELIRKAKGERREGEGK